MYRNTLNFNPSPQSCGDLLVGLCVFGLRHSSAPNGRRATPLLPPLYLINGRVCTAHAHSMECVRNEPRTLTAEFFHCLVSPLSSLARTVRLSPLRGQRCARWGQRGGGSGAPNSLGKIIISLSWPVFRIASVVLLSRPLVTFHHFRYFIIIFQAAATAVVVMTVAAAVMRTEYGSVYTDAIRSNDREREREWTFTMCAACLHSLCLARTMVGSLFVWTIKDIRLMKLISTVFFFINNSGDFLAGKFLCFPFRGIQGREVMPLSELSIIVRGREVIVRDTTAAMGGHNWWWRHRLCPPLSQVVGRVIWPWRRWSFSKTASRGARANLGSNKRPPPDRPGVDEQLASRQAKGRVSRLRFARGWADSHCCLCWLVVVDCLVHSLFDLRPTHTPWY